MTNVMQSLVQSNKSKPIINQVILAIESSCDETAVAIYHHHKGLIANVVFSQIELHRPFGGVVPEIASRDHLLKITFLLDEALNQAGIFLKDITAIAYTKGPGLAGALLVGVSFAKSLGVFNQIKTFAIHHMHGHLVAPMLENKNLKFPFVCLLISGGHTLILDAKKLNDYKILGQSRDDALGEAFDKIAKMMGLNYPGGAELSQLAQKCQKSKYLFPRPMLKQKNLDFSFSGLKTHALQTYLSSNQSDEEKKHIAKAFEDAIIEVILAKTSKAIKQTKYQSLVVSGGVSANIPLRSALVNQFGKNNVFFPSLALCSDNAAMIAYACYLNLLDANKKKDNSGGVDKTPCDIEIKPRWSMEDIQS